MDTAIELNQVRKLKLKDSREEGEECEMQPFIKDIVNTASAHGGRILITDDLVRLAFPDKLSCVDFLDTLREKQPALSPYRVDKFLRVDFAHSLKLCKCA